MKNIVIINGSASENSSNQKIIDIIYDLTKDLFNITIFNGLKHLPHFDPDLTENNTPKAILNFRELIEKSDGIIICSPEYIFSIPSGLKNSIEWCVSTTVFYNKPTGIITASASGIKGHEELKLIMQTLMTNTPKETTLLIQGIKGKINKNGELQDDNAHSALLDFIKAMVELVENKNS